MVQYCFVFFFGMTMRFQVHEWKHIISLSLVLTPKTTRFNTFDSNGNINMFLFSFRAERRTPRTVERSSIYCYTLKISLYRSVFIICAVFVSNKQITTKAIICAICVDAFCLFDLPIHRQNRYQLVCTRQPSSVWNRNQSDEIRKPS